MVECVGSINLREFLVTMLAVQPTSPEDSLPPDTLAMAHSTSGNSSGDADGEDMCRMFFRIFDIDNNGSINMEEFELALQHLHNITPHAVTADGQEESEKQNSWKDSGTNSFMHNVEELFREMDVNRDNKITYCEFKKFYNEVLKHHSTVSAVTTPRHVEVVVATMESPSDQSC